MAMERMEEPAPPKCQKSHVQNPNVQKALVWGVLEWFSISDIPDGTPRPLALARLLSGRESLGLAVSLEAVPPVH